MRQPRRTTWLLALVAVGGLAACNGDDGGATTDAGDPDSSDPPGPDAAIDAPGAVDLPFDLDLGHVDRIATLERRGDRALSVDDDHHWVLWDLGTRAQVARGEARMCESAFPCAPPLAFMRGDLLVVRAATGLELRSAVTGQLTGMAATATTRIGAASDGSYAWAATATGLTAWRPNGTVLVSAAGNYDRAVVFGAPTELRVGAGAAGAGMVETIRVADGMRTTAPHSGTFHSWFLDGARFLTNTGGLVRVYSAAGVQVGFGMITTANLTGQGDHVWTCENQGIDHPLKIYAATNLAAPLETYELSTGDVAIPAGNTIGVIRNSSITRALEVICRVGGPAELGACRTECDDAGAGAPAPALASLCDLTCGFYMQDVDPLACSVDGSADCRGKCATTIVAKGRICAQCVIEQTGMNRFCINESCDCEPSFELDPPFGCDELCDAAPPT